MKSRNIFIPATCYSRTPEGHFNWNLDGPVIESELNLFMLVTFPGDGSRSWLFSGRTGHPDTQNIFEFGLSVPYLGDEVLDKTYTLENGLTFSHMCPLPEIPGAAQTIDADIAELTIRLDPIEQTVQGEYKATFKTLRLAPSGTFKLKGFTEEKDQQDGELVTLVGGAV